MSRYHLIDTRTGEIVKQLPRRPNPRVLRVRRTTQTTRDAVIAASFTVALVAVLILV